MKTQTLADSACNVSDVANASLAAEGGLFVNVDSLDNNSPVFLRMRKNNFILFKFLFFVCIQYLLIDRIQLVEQKKRNLNWFC